MAATVLFYGAGTHPGLRRLFQRVQERGRRQACYLDWEAFPDLILPAGMTRPEAGSLSVDGAALPLGDICSVCLDGIYAAPRPGPLSESDQAFAQTEVWSTLIALFGALSQRVPVANLVQPRDVIESRAALMSYLGRHGLEVPRMLVTSDPQAAQDFYRELDGRVQCRTVAYTAAASRTLTEPDLQRLDAIRLSPVHFEELPAGPQRTVTVVGDAVFGSSLPKKLKGRCGAACQGLGLHMAVITVVEGGGQWLATDVQTHLTAEVLEEPKILNAAVEFLEARR